MRYFRTKAFLDTFKSIGAQRQKRVTKSLTQLDLMLTAKESPIGLGLKQLKGGIWEIRAGLADRILFTKEEDLVSLLIIGNHDDIKRYLKRC